MEPEGINITITQLPLACPSYALPKRKKAFYLCTKILLGFQVMYPWSCVHPEGVGLFYSIHAEGVPLSKLHKDSLWDLRGCAWRGKKHCQLMHMHVIGGQRISLYAQGGVSSRP